MGLLDRFYKREARPKSISRQIQVVDPVRTKQDMSSWRNATIVAEDKHHPDRADLIDIYGDVILDGRVKGLIDQRKSAVLGCNWALFDDEDQDEAATEYLQVAWFQKFMSYMLDSIFYGHSLIEFGRLVNGQFEDIMLIDRRLVCPEFGFVRKTEGATSGIDYRFDKKESVWVVESPETHDFGLFINLFPLYFQKKNTWQSWAEFIERFGLPILEGTTDALEPGAKAALANNLKNMGRSGSIVLDNNDEIKLHEVTRTDSYQVFERNITMADTEMTVLVLGQTSTTQEKSFVGAAEVQERVAERILKQDKEMLKYIVNQRLLPKLILHGYPLDGKTFDFIEGNTTPIDTKIKAMDSLLRHGYSIDPEEVEEQFGLVVSADQSQVNFPLPAEQ